jgi:hypothetical protein
MQVWCIQNSVQHGMAQRSMQHSVQASAARTSGSSLLPGRGQNMCTSRPRVLSMPELLVEGQVTLIRIW